MNYYDEDSHYRSSSDNRELYDRSQLPKKGIAMEPREKGEIRFASDFYCDDNKLDHLTRRIVTSDNAQKGILKRQWRDSLSGTTLNESVTGRERPPPARVADRSRVYTESETRGREYNMYRDEDDLSEAGIQNKINEPAMEVSESKDLTIHLELNVIEDIEPDLDEFCRLTKLGNFNTAKRFFFENLQSQMKNPYVSVQYAQMLLDMGDYSSVEALGTPIGINDTDILRLNWDLVQLLAGLHIKGVSEIQVNSVVQEAVGLLQMTSRDHSLGSTEIQVLSLVLRLLAKRYPCIQDKGLSISSQFSWNELYEQLLAKGLIWDLRDVFIALLLYGDRETARSESLLFRFDPYGFIDTLVEDWLTLTFDEPVSLALLDIYASICLRPITSPEAYAVAKRCLYHSESIALSIADNDIGLLTTGPYLRWSLAKARVLTYNKREILRVCTPLSKLPGQFFPKREAIDIPLYIPTQSETVDWKLLTHSPHANESIEIVLNTAERLGDYNTESMARQMLVYRSQDPLKELDKLIALQRSVQHDMHSCLLTILAKYIPCKDEGSRRGLRDEILEIDDLEDFPKTLRTIRAGVLKAFSYLDPDDARSYQEESLTVPTGPRNQGIVSRSELPVHPPHETGSFSTALVLARPEKIHDQIGSHTAERVADREESSTDAETRPHGAEDSGEDTYDTGRPKQTSVSDTSSMSTTENGRGSLGAPAKGVESQNEEDDVSSEDAELGGPSASDGPDI